MFFHFFAKLQEQVAVKYGVLKVQNIATVIIY